MSEAVKCLGDPAQIRQTIGAAALKQIHRFHN